MLPDDIIALDVGQKNTGLARASEQARIAEPLMSVSTDEAPKVLKKLSSQYGVKTVVAGLPRGLSGQDTAQTKWLRGWLNDLKKEVPADYYLQDEALTTRLADKQHRASKKFYDDHAMAAAIILQDFLDTPESERVVC